MLRSAHPTPSLRLYPRAIWIGYLLVSLAVSHAQVPTAIVPDGSLGTVVTPDGSVFDITDGTRPENGPNLFHSFGQFDVGTGATARFVSQQGIENIIGRVTGGSASRIDGRLQADASLFLLNPSGLIFGPNATLDVSGSFHASTADVLRFADGAAFSARLNEKSTLTVASPSAFGFLHTHPADIAIERSHLEVPEGEALSIVGGNIEMTAGTLEAPSGQVTITSVASTGEAMLNNVAPSTDIDVEDFDRLGDIRITQTGLIDTRGAHGGRVVLRGGHLMIDNASIQVGTRRALGGREAGIDIEVLEEIFLNRGVISTVAQGDRDAADIRVTTGDLRMEGFSRIVSETSSAGRAGHVAVDAANVTLLEGAQVSSLTFGPGDGGTVAVRATNAVILSGMSEDGYFSSGLFANSQGIGAAAGAAGAVEVEAANVTATDGAAMSSSAFGSGTGGRVRIEAADTVVLADASTLLNASGPSGGTIRIRSGRLLIDGARAFADTIGDAHGPEIGIDIQVDGDVVLSNGARVAADGFGHGNAGSIRVAADRVAISGGAFLRSRTSEGDAGRAGSIAIVAADVQVAGAETRIDAETRGSGSAGSIRIEADRLAIAEGAQLSTSTLGPGAGGTLTVRAREAIDIIDASGGPFRSGLFSNSGEDQEGGPAGDAGDIVIQAPRLTVDGGRILTRTLGDGNAGNITIEVDRLELLGGAQIFNGIGIAQGNGEILGNPNGTGRGGQLAVRVADAVVIAGEDRPGFSSGLFSSAQIGYGNAGDISISAPRLLIDAGGRIASDTLGSGAGGTVDVVATESISISGRRSDGTPSGMFSSASASGSGGDIQLQARRVQLDDGASISAASSGVGSAGTIRIAGADTLLLSGNSAVTTEAAQASGGNIEIAAQTLVRLRDSAITATVSGGPETIGGNITVDPEFVVLEDSRIVSNANQGRGGNINIEAGVFLADPGSAVSAVALDSQVGIDGEVSVEAVATNLSDVVSPLPPDFALDASLLRDRCAAQLREGTVSSLVARGRASVPPTPEGILPSRLYQPPQASAAPSETERQPAAAMAAPQRPRIINGPFPADAPVALECEWTTP